MVEEMSHSTEMGLIFISLILLGLIIFYAYQTYVRKAVIPAGDAKALPLFGRMVYNKFYIDKIYTAVFEKPFGFLSDFFFKKVENVVLDPFVDGVGAATSRLGTTVRRLQPGNMSFYLFAMVFGILLFIVFILII
jgi:NADH-quinone oxidoreductase subunit L